jgi:hypothetical protein
MKKNELFILSVFVLFMGILTFSATIFPEGNHDVRGESRRAEGFDQIVSSGDYKVFVKQGEAYGVEVWAESNLLPLIETEVIDHRLIIRTRGLHRLLQNHPIEVFVTTPVLNGLLLSGSGMIKTGRFTSEQFNVILSGSGDIDSQVSTHLMSGHVSGSGNVYLQGDATRGRFVISGSGKIKSFGSRQRNCEAIILGSGNMYLNSVETIDARITGSGQVLYINHPIVNKSVYGSGNVLNMNQENKMLTER